VQAIENAMFSPFDGGDIVAGQPAAAMTLCHERLREVCVVAKSASSRCRAAAPAS
jgi:hypothetical protein